MLKSLPFQLILCILCAFFMGDYLSIHGISFFFTLSCVLKEFLMTILPVVVFSYIAAAILSLEQRAPVLIISILVLVCLSNFIAVMASYFIAIITLPFFNADRLTNITVMQDTILPLINFTIPQLLSPDKAMISGILWGLIFSIRRVERITYLTQKTQQIVTQILQRTFIPLLPIYVFGFVLKMHYEGNLGSLFANYGQVFLLTCLLITGYITFLYMIAAQGRPGKFLTLVRTMLPAGLTGFSTMSSAATMPITLAATQENIENKQFTQLVIPATVNIHLLGDALGVPLLGMAVLSLSGMPLPSIDHFMIFAVYFCIAKFSTAGIPGGGIIVLLPVLQNYLGLTPEIIGLVTTLYILQDSVFTASNVMGNGAFALISYRFLKVLRLVKTAPVLATA